MIYLSVFVLIPLAAVVVKAVTQGPSAFFDTVTNSVALTTLGITLGASLVVAAIGAVMGTLVAWVLVRDRFPGQRFVNSLIDLPIPGSPEISTICPSPCLRSWLDSP